MARVDAETNSSMRFAWLRLRSAGPTYVAESDHFRLRRSHERLSEKVSDFGDSLQPTLPSP